MKKIFKEILVDGLKIQNPIVLAPLATWLSDESGEVKKNHIEHYKKRKGPGLIIVEAAAVSPEGRLSATQLGIFDDKQISGLSELRKTIEANGDLPGIQIHHAGGKATLKTTYGLTPLVPSKSGVSENKECRELSIKDILRIESDFVLAAERAVQAGFKYIEIHGAHGYLGNQFLSLITNKRTDKYGGSLENRQRFLMEIFTAVQEKVNGKALVSCRLGAAENEGISLDEGIDTAKRFETLGMKIINISCGHSLPEMSGSIDNDYSILMNLGAEIKKNTNMIVIGVGGVKESEQAENILDQGLVDMVAVGKAILCDPQWAWKTLNGTGETINKCLDCKKCFWFTEPEKCPVHVKREKIKNS
ncbi:MAG: NADH:flavin oxidoreductase [Spirochaetaceae bacterium]|jgi:NADPH2 dehydrogenase|nr:NADH:flavin oxidoreductase [Spirochaetaceae bacterium]